jgi:arginase
MSPFVPRTIHIIGVPLDLGQGRRGVDKGDLAVPIQETRSPGNQSKKYVRDIARVCQRLFQVSIASFEAGALPVVLGGDHSISAGSVAASSEWAHRQGQPLGLLWIDAHGDINTPQSSTSGNVHGMPLSALLGNEPHELAKIGGRSPKVQPEHTVLVGIRDLDAREKDIVRGSGLHVFTMNDIDRQGIAAIAEQAIAIAGRGTAGIHVSFDLDVCDPAIAPGVGTQVRGGIDYREGHLLMELVADSGLLVSLDLVEINPILDTQNSTAILATEFALSALGQKIL